jgi:kynurenine formamidase
MKLNITIGGESYYADLSSPLDISIPLRGDASNPIAWNLDSPKMDPVKLGDWIGKVSKGASVNFNTITFNPHAHGTHTECLGHISADFNSVNDALKRFFFNAVLITVDPKRMGKDLVITKDLIAEHSWKNHIDALVIRTLPNNKDKMNQKYVNYNWPYIDEKAAVYIRDHGIEHLMIDTPSVDKEDDGGKLLAHKAFWNYPEAPRHHSTITEMIYVTDDVKDGEYLLSLQLAPFHNDAAPSRPVLYELK